MQLTIQKRITLFTLFGLSHWFFGNLYEAVVFGPNWAINNPQLLVHLNSFFVSSNPNIYFVPLTIVTSILVWILTFINKVDDVKKEYKIASVIVLIITILTFYIVVFILSKMFGQGFFENINQGYQLGKIWNYLNFIRMLLELTAMYYLFNIYRKLEKL